ncbi:hypothetical protein LIER_13176 [Lithospermum erythrorhizon]|uniref:Uncharacterized protein n=1 Tax=Lithospermum erythrorhizon TaxID=34254 RepID=A0AAV3PYN6_LITER
MDVVVEEWQTSFQEVQECSRWGMAPIAGARISGIGHAMGGNSFDWQVMESMTLEGWFIGVGEEVER